MGTKSLVKKWLAATAIASVVSVNAPAPAEAHNGYPSGISLAPEAEKGPDVDKLFNAIEEAVELDIIEIHDGGASGEVRWENLLNPAKKQAFLDILSKVGLALGQPNARGSLDTDRPLAEQKSASRTKKQTFKKGKPSHKPRTTATKKTNSVQPQAESLRTASKQTATRVNEMRYLSHVAQSLANPAVSADFIKNVLAEPALSPDLIAQMQASLTIDGYDAGVPSGVFNKKTAEALGRFFTENPLERLTAEKFIITEMGKHLTLNQMDILFEDSENYEPSRAEGTLKNLPRKTPKDWNLANAEMLLAMEKRPDLKSLFEAVMDAAQDPDYKNPKIDPHFAAAVVWRELGFLNYANPKKWPLDYFNKRIVGPKGEKICCWGPGQFHKQTAQTVGLMTEEDLRDPIKNGRGSVYHMRDLAAKVNGDLILVNAGYNGPGSIALAEKRFGKSVNGIGSKRLTGEDLMAYLDEEYRKSPKRSKATVHAFRFETRDYIRDIHSRYWPESRVERALTFDINTKNPAFAWEGQIEPETPIAHIIPKQCTLESQLQPELKAIEAETRAAEVERPGGLLTLEDSAKIGILKEKERKLESQKCTPAANSAQFFQDAARRYPVTGKFLKTLPTPAKPTKALKFEL